jgi:TonB family protein
MDYAASYPSPQPPSDPSLKGMLPWSLLFHALLLGGVTAAAMLHPRSENWGSGTAGGTAVQVGMVHQLPGVPLPQPDALGTSRVADESKALYKATPEEKVSPPPDTSIQIPEFEKERMQRYLSRKSRLLEDKSTPPPNAVPGPSTGAAQLPYSQAQTSGTFALGSTQAGVAMSSPGSGDFGSRYPWFAEALRNRISSNWVQSMVDPSIRAAPRAIVTFQILRDGSITNIQVVQSSGIASVDNCARRAILASSPVMRLPNDYYGSVLNVEFYFDFRR